MTWLITTAISNAAIATVLGLLAYVVGRRSKNAAVGHVAWVLVFVKLVTPPLLELPLPVLPAWAMTASVASVDQQQPILQDCGATSFAHRVDARSGRANQASH